MLPISGRIAESLLETTRSAPEMRSVHRFSCFRSGEHAEQPQQNDQAKRHAKQPQNDEHHDDGLLCMKLEGDLPPHRSANVSAPLQCRGRARTLLDPGQHPAGQVARPMPKTPVSQADTSESRSLKINRPMPTSTNPLTSSSTCIRALTPRRSRNEVPSANPATTNGIPRPRPYTKSSNMPRPT